MLRTLSGPSKEISSFSALISPPLFTLDAEDGLMRTDQFTISSRALPGSCPARCPPDEYRYLAPVNLFSAFGIITKKSEKRVAVTSNNLLLFYMYRP